MENENNVIFYSQELNEDIYQNNKLLDSKKIILETNKTEHICENSYNTIVDTKDYLGCINNNCSIITEDNTNGKNNSNNSNNTNNLNIETNISNYITKLIDFIFILLLVGLLIFILYKRESVYLLYVLGITLLYIFIKFIMLSNLFYF